MKKKKLPVKPDWSAFPKTVKGERRFRKLYNAWYNHFVIKAKRREDLRAYHARIIKGDRPLKCRYCGKCYVRWSWFYKHIATKHSGERRIRKFKIRKYRGPVVHSVGDLQSLPVAKFTRRISAIIRGDEILSFVHGFGLDVITKD